MESTKKKGLADLDAVVYTSGLLPLLSMNEVLRLRRVCEKLKSVCDEYLRLKCPSKNIVRLRDYKEDDRFYKDSVSEFLDFDSNSNIKFPTQHFDLNFGMIMHQLGVDLSKRYGAQMKHLSMNEMELPFVKNSSQFNFFENLPNLSSLTLREIAIIEQTDANDADREIVPESLPTCFKNSLRKLAVLDLSFNRESDADKFWETVGLCEKLECFGFPQYNMIKDRHHPSPSLYQVLENCCKLIGTESSNIKCFDLQNLECHFINQIWYSEETLKLFSELSLRKQIKWQNVPAWMFDRKALYKTVWRPNVDLIVSMSRFSSQNVEGLSFPNLVSLDVWHISLNLPGIEEDWSQIPQILSPSIYPALRILRVTRVYSVDNKYFSRIWKYLTTLEEVSFEFDDCDVMNLSSQAFLGDEGTREPPFLHLIRLRKLSFHILLRYIALRASICDAFHQAFRLMPLKEFNITSQTPVKSDFCDKDAILALCSPGPFIENIEKFSFRSWSMAGVTKDEFRQLGRMFPNNQAM